MFSRLDRSSLGPKVAARGGRRGTFASSGGVLSHVGWWVEQARRGVHKSRICMIASLCFRGEIPIAPSHPSFARLDGKFPAKGEIAEANESKSENKTAKPPKGEAAEAKSRSPLRGSGERGEQRLGGCKSILCKGQEGKQEGALSAEIIRGAEGHAAGGLSRQISCL